MNVLSKPKRVTIIAEAGVNHNGSIDLAKQLIDVAKDAGADAVKFQTFKTELCITEKAKKADYQKDTTGATESQFDMVKKLELNYEAHKTLNDHCAEKDITFFSTAFDLPSLDFLADEMHLPYIKIPSGDALNAPLLLAAASKKKDIILSTGMCSLGDIETALGVIAFGLTATDATLPNSANFAAAYRSDAGQYALAERVSILHCTTEYPAPFEDVNLRVLKTLQSAFELPVGLSDHTNGIAASVAAVALGGTIIEKHFTLDKTMEGPDHRASLEPDELRQMITAIRQVELALGDGKKYARESEIRNMQIARKFIVAAKPIQQGQLIQIDDLICKRSDFGVSPVLLWDLVGTEAPCDYAVDDLIKGC